MSPRIVPADPFEPLTPEIFEALRDAYPNVGRLAVAFNLSLDVEACEDLLAGRPVVPGRLDQAEVEKARRRTLVQLVAPINLVDTEEPA